MIVSRCILTIALVGMIANALPVTKRPPSSSSRSEEGDSKPKTAMQNKKDKKDLWWANPCGVKGGHKRKIEDTIGDLTESTEEPITKGWILTLQRTLARMKPIEEFYKNVSEFKDFDLGWLPDYKFAQKQPPPRRSVNLISQLYQGLQKFAATIECLMDGPDCIHKSKRVKDEMDSKRRDLLQEIKKELRSLLCEVKSLLEHLKKRIPKAPTSAIIDALKWLTESGNTGKSVQDWGVIYNYMRYLTEWEKTAKILVFKNGGTKLQKNGNKQIVDIATSTDKTIRKKEKGYKLSRGNKRKHRNERRDVS